MEGTQTQEALRAELVAKAAEDDGFRATHVHEKTALSAHLVLPPSAGLTDADLEAPMRHKHEDEIMPSGPLPG